MNRSYLSLTLFFIVFFAGIYGRGTASVIGAWGILLFELWYVLKFLGYIFAHKQRAVLFTLAMISVCTYVIFFRYINSQELWVDEIQVIRFGQLPLEKIAFTVMTEHTAVPPLDYWNMWIWNKIAYFFAVTYSEFVYRVPYMVIHTITAFLLAILCWEITGKRPRLTGVLAITAGFLLYFYNPLPFVYSYEIRFYTMMLLGAVVVLTLYYQKKLYSISYFPLILLFCLNSVFHFFILAPFILKGVIDSATRKNALLLYCGVALTAMIIFPLLYVPRPDVMVYAPERVFIGLIWLRNFYFDAPWKLYVASIALLLPVLLRRKHAVFLFIICVFYILVVAGLDIKYNYRYFGAKHFLFIIPFCTVMIYKMLDLGKSTLFRMSVVGILALFFVYPFYISLRKIYTGNLLLAKSPVGLKYVFQYAQTHRIGTMLIDYGGASDEDIQYYRLGVAWYAEHYPKQKIIEESNYRGCKKMPGFKSALMFSVIGIPNCENVPSRVVTKLFDGAMITK